MGVVAINQISILFDNILCAVFFSACRQLVDNAKNKYIPSQCVVGRGWRLSWFPLIAIWEKQSLRKYRFSFSVQM